MQMTFFFENLLLDVSRLIIHQVNLSLHCATLSGSPSYVAPVIESVAKRHPILVHYQRQQDQDLIKLHILCCILYHAGHHLPPSQI